MKKVIHLLFMQLLILPAIAEAMLPLVNDTCADGLKVVSDGSTVWLNGEKAKVTQLDVSYFGVDTDDYRATIYVSDNHQIAVYSRASAETRHMPCTPDIQSLEDQTSATE